MPAALFYDPDQYDYENPVIGPAEIEAVNPQRGDMRHLDGIAFLEDDMTGVVGFKNVRGDEFWIPGHIPGRPLLPGVIMIEAAAQLAAFIMSKRRPDAGFIGFVGCDNVKFRGQVTPGQRLILMGREVKFKPRRVICDAQGVVDGQLVFEARITGMPI